MGRPQIPPFPMADPPSSAQTPITRDGQILPGTDTASRPFWMV